MLRVTGYECWISTSDDALQTYQYFAREANEFYTVSSNETPPQLLMEEFIEGCGSTGTDYKGRSIIPYSNTLRSYLPALWMVQSMQSSIQTKQPITSKKVNNQPISDAVEQVYSKNLTPAEVLKETGLAYAHAGSFDFAIDNFMRWIELKDADN